MATTFSPKTYVDESNDPAIDATNLNINEQATYSLSLDTNTLRKVSKGKIDKVPLLALTLLNGKVLDSPITVGTNPTGLCFDGTYVYVTNYGSNSVSVINTSTHAVYKTITVGGNPIDVCFDGTYVYVTNTGGSTVSVIDASTHTVYTTITVGTNPRGLCFDGTYVYVANYGSNNISVLVGL